MKIYNIIKVKRDDIKRIAIKRGARNIRLIGSVARKEATENSDIDFIVDFDHGRTLLDHAALIIELEKLLGLKVDVAAANGLRKHIRESVLKDALSL